MRINNSINLVHKTIGLYVIFLTVHPSKYETNSIEQKKLNDQTPPLLTSVGDRAPNPPPPIGLLVDTTGRVAGFNCQ